MAAPQVRVHIRFTDRFLPSLDLIMPPQERARLLADIAIRERGAPPSWVRYRACSLRDDQEQTVTLNLGAVSEVR